jgi:predicted N-acetyltransferase YhbS
LLAPSPLTAQHKLDDFDCGVQSLNEWLKRRALGNQANGATRCFVAAEKERVIAYYALASGAIASSGALGRFRRNMPDPIPVAVLARLAVDREFQEKHIGRSLLRDASLRIMQAAETLGIRGIVVHAISQEAKRFYIAHGFDESPLDPMTLMITLNDLGAVLP